MPRRKPPKGERDKLEAVLAERDFLEYTFPVVRPSEEMIAAATSAETGVGATADQRRAWIVFLTGRLLAERDRAQRRVASLLADIDPDRFSPEGSALGEDSLFTNVTLWALQRDFPDLKDYRLDLSRADRVKLERAACFAAFGQAIDSALGYLKVGDFHRAAAEASKLLSADNFAAAGGRPRTHARQSIEREAKELLKQEPSLSDRELARRIAPERMEDCRKIIAKGRHSGRIPPKA